MYIELKTRRLLLRPLRMEDFEAVHAYASDPENTRFMLFLPNETEEETRQFLCRAVAEWEKEYPLAYEFGVTLEGQLIGAVSVVLDIDFEAEIGWILNKRYWGKGYATEAAIAVRDFALEKFFLLDLKAHCDARNVASYRVMRKLGFYRKPGSGIRVYPKTGETAREITCTWNNPWQLE